MALIKCTECGNQISDTAKMCPHCGKEPEHIKANAEVAAAASKHFGIVIAAAILGVIGVCLFFSGNSALSDRGVSFFSDDWSSYSPSIREAGLKCVAGIVLVIVCLLAVIISKKFTEYQMNQVASSADERVRVSISGRCDLCDTQGKTAICRIPDLPGKYELCTDCIVQYMAQTDDCQQAENSKNKDTYIGS